MEATDANLAAIHRGFNDYHARIQSAGDVDAALGEGETRARLGRVKLTPDPHGGVCGGGSSGSSPPSPEYPSA